MYRVLIIGSGQLGSRHLQAVASLPFVETIDVVDPRSEGLTLGRQRLKEITDLQPHIRFNWLARLEDAQLDGDLCVIATQAEGRYALVEKAATLGYRRFLLEKIVTQSVAAYDRLLALARDKRLSIWVNCKSRAHPIWKHVKARIEPDASVLYSSIGGNHGLANNGVHMADLFVFFTGTTDIGSAGSRIDSVRHATKRGQFDLSGTLQASTDKGRHFTLSYASDHVESPVDVVMTRRYRWVVDQMKRQAFEGVASEGWELRPIPFEGNLSVSHMTKAFASDILQQGKCELPTLASAIRHIASSSRSCCLCSTACLARMTINVR